MRFFESSDYAQIAGWFRARGMEPPRRGDFPSFGLIEEGIGAGFLMVTDTPLAIIDFFITNPDAARRRRHAAMDAITEGLLRQAKHLGFRAVKGDSKFVVIKNLAKRCGFQEAGNYSCFIKEL